MIRYNGLMMPCFFSPEGAGQIMAPSKEQPCPSGTKAVTRLESKRVFMHVCKGHEHMIDTLRPSYIPLTGDDVFQGHSADPRSLFLESPWILEIDGVTREEFLKSYNTGKS